MNSKKIVLVSSEFPPLPGGIGNHALNLALALTEKGYHITVLTDQRESNNKENDFDKQLKFEVIRTGLQQNRKLMYLKRIQQLFILSRKNEVFIASGKFSLWMVALLSLFYSRKYIAVVHGTEVNLLSKTLRNITEFSLKQMHAVISVSKYTKSFTDHLKLKNSVVIPNGFTIENHSLENKKMDSYPNLVTVGRVSKRKGQVNIINALPEIKKQYPNVCYHMIGIPEDKGQLISLAINLGVQNNIVFYGKQDYNSLYSIVAKSDIFMMLSQNDDKGDIEGFGIAILEANHFGIPAIGSLGCGIEDAIKNKYSGVLVNPTDKIQIINAITEILTESNKYNINAIEWSRKFNWDKVVLDYLRVLK